MAKIPNWVKGGKDSWFNELTGNEVKIQKKIDLETRSKDYRIAGTDIKRRFDNKSNARKEAVAWMRGNPQEYGDGLEWEQRGNEDRIYTMAVRDPEKPSKELYRVEVIGSHVEIQHTYGVSGNDKDVRNFDSETEAKNFAKDKRMEIKERLAADGYVPAG